MLSLSRAEFEEIRALVHKVSGINLHQGKEELVKARLAKRLRALNINSFSEYLSYIKDKKEELAAMVEALTTNKTNFFREPQHFEFLRSEIIPKLRGKEIRIWSAGCSSGEEPYSIAMLLLDELTSEEIKEVRILATDISERVLAKARSATYQQYELDGVPPQMLQKYFICTNPKPPRTYQLSERVTSLVRIARLNLIDHWPMRCGFDLIFCRNVMIYFDKNTQRELVNRFWEILKPGGYLFVGHSESLAAASHPFKYLRPAVYIKQV